MARIGIDADTAERLFLPFTQADGSTTRKFGGTGLGLAITRQLVELMGGEIGVHSVPRLGSMFWFRLPALPVTDEHHSGPAISVGAAPSKVRAALGALLLVEDNAVNREVALLNLRALGYQTEAVGSGRAALAAVRARQFALILMDCQMPDMDGFDTTAKIRDFEATPEGGAGGRRVPIVALTANAMAGDRERCLAAGMDDYVSKPYTRHDLQTLLQRWLATDHGHQRPRRGAIRAAPSSPVSGPGATD